MLKSRIVIFQNLKTQKLYQQVKVLTHLTNIP